MIQNTLNQENAITFLSFMDTVLKFLVENKKIKKKFFAAALDGFNFL